MVVPKVDMLPLSNGRKRGRRRGARNQIPDKNPLSGGGKSVAVFHGKGIADKKVANDISTLYNSSGNDIKSKQADVSTSEHKNKLMKKRLNMTTLGHRIWYEESQEAVQVQDAEDGDQVPAAEDGEQVLAAEDDAQVLAAEEPAQALAAEYSPEYTPVDVEGTVQDDTVLALAHGDAHGRQACQALTLEEALECQASQALVLEEVLEHQAFQVLAQEENLGRQAAPALTQEEAPGRQAVQIVANDDKLMKTDNTVRCCRC